MGLDMTLYASIYYSPYREEDVKTIDTVTKTAGINDYIEDDGSCIIQVQAMYWRKANAIHNWFVKNVQNGIDDCREYYVSQSKLIELRDICERILNDKDLSYELLPPASGFFFGSQVVDEWYMKDLKATVKRFDELISLQNQRNDRVMFYYRSSW